MHLVRQNALQRAHSDWIAGKIDKTGVMIHNVISAVDMGAPIIVQEIPFIKGVDESLDSLEERIHQIEWKVIVTGTEMAIKEIWDKRKGVAIPESKIEGS